MTLNILKLDFYSYITLIYSRVIITFLISPTFTPLAPSTKIYIFLLKLRSQHNCLAFYINIFFKELWFFLSQIPKLVWPCLLRMSKTKSNHLFYHYFWWNFLKFHLNILYLSTYHNIRGHYRKKERKKETHTHIHTKNQLKQHFATTFGHLAQKLMVLIHRNTFWVHFTMLAPCSIAFVNSFNFHGIFLEDFLDWCNMHIYPILAILQYGLGQCTCHL